MCYTEGAMIVVDTLCLPFTSPWGLPKPSLLVVNLQFKIFKLIPDGYPNH
jgi:hypothetical protein